MNDDWSKDDVLVDYVTGQAVPHVGTEAVRQRMEHFLVDEKGYARDDISVGAAIVVEIRGEVYRSRLDLTVGAGGRRFMVIKCVAGSLGSWQREILAAARIFEKAPIPLAVVTDGATALVYDTVSGKKIGEGLLAIPSREEAARRFAGVCFEPLSADRLEKEKLLFRSYDAMKVNVV